MWTRRKKYNQLLDAHVALLIQVRALKKELGETLAAAQQTGHTPPTISQQPLYLTENEEDIQYAYDNEMIDKDAYEDMLRQLDFDNATITFDYENLY